MRLFSLAVLLFASLSHAQTIRVATFNVSMEASNYQQQNQALQPDKLRTLLKQGDHPQIKILLRSFSEFDQTSYYSMSLIILRNLSRGLSRL